MPTNYFKELSGLLTEPIWYTKVRVSLMGWHYHTFKCKVPKLRLSTNTSAHHYMGIEVPSVLVDRNLLVNFLGKVYYPCRCVERANRKAKAQASKGEAS